MVSKSRQEQLDLLSVGAPFGRGIDHDKYFTIGIVLLVLASYGWYRGYLAYTYSWQALERPSVIEPFSTVIHINTARKVELSLLPGVGPKLAQAILDYRAEHGPFKTWEDLDQVRGIGPKTIEGIKQFGTLD